MDDVMIGMDGRVVPELPSSYDNVGDDGQVRYLDAERLARKEWEGGPVYRNRPASVAQDLIWPKLSLRPWNYGMYAAIFHYAKPHLWRSGRPESAMGAALRNVIMMDDPEKDHTGGVVINLNVDLSDKAESVVVPYDLVVHALEKADYIGAVDHGKCIGCYKCMATACPQDALQVRASDGKVVVNQETCFGCGYCKQACPTGAIKIRQTIPMRESLHEYFLTERALDLVVD